MSGTANRTRLGRGAVLALAVVTVVCLLGMLVCVICDAAISGRFTWSPIPVSSIVLAWTVLFPVLLRRKWGCVLSLLVFSLLIVPYLLLLSRLIGVREVFSMGAVLAGISLAFLWVAAGVFLWIGRERRLTALGVAILMGVPLLMAVNVVLAHMIAEPVFDVWDGVCILVLVILAAVFVFCDAARRKRMAGQ